MERGKDVALPTEWKGRGRPLLDAVVGAKRDESSLKVELDTKRYLRAQRCQGAYQGLRKESASDK